MNHLSFLAGRSICLYSAATVRRIVGTRSGAGAEPEGVFARVLFLGLDARLRYSTGAFPGTVPGTIPGPVLKNTLIPTAIDHVTGNVPGTVLKNVIIPAAIDHVTWNGPRNYAQDHCS